MAAAKIGNDFEVSIYFGSWPEYQLRVVDKFNYLLTLLSGAAAAAIAGL